MANTDQYWRTHLDKRLCPVRQTNACLSAIKSQYKGPKPLLMHQIENYTAMIEIRPQVNLYKLRIQHFSLELLNGNSFQSMWQYIGSSHDLRLIECQYTNPRIQYIFETKKCLCQQCY